MSEVLIRAVQTKLGITADGIAGNMTWNAIAKALRATTSKNDTAVFNEIRRVFGNLSQVQVDSISKLLAATATWKKSWIAYALATAWHESRLMPIKEAGSDKYLSKYDTGSLAKALGNTPEADGDGIKYAGRGYVQLTGLANYTKAEKALKIPLVKNPDLALEVGNAVNILVWGMYNGAFTSKALRDYLPGEAGTEAQFTQARRIINGTDRAAMIAKYAISFQNALTKGGW